MSRGPAQLVHLARRAMWNLVPRSLTPTDTTFVRSHLRAGVADRFFALDSRDQVHSVAVARRVLKTPDLPAEVVEAALLHDIGKAHARLGVVGRAVATAIEWTPLRDRIEHLDQSRAGDDGTADQRADDGGSCEHDDRVGFWRRISRYLRYEELGARDLVRLGYAADSLPVRWSREHHLPDDHWSVPIEYGWVLAAADH